mgnify:CR=1 FL=1
MQDQVPARHAPNDPEHGPGPLGHVLVTSMRDEGPYALEFVAHHRAVGFDRIFIASNDCRDGTDLLLDALDRAVLEVCGPWGSRPRLREFRAMLDQPDIAGEVARLYPRGWLIQEQLRQPVEIEALIGAQLGHDDQPWVTEKPLLLGAPTWRGDS